MVPDNPDPHKITADQFSFNEAGELVINSDEISDILENSKKNLTEYPLTKRESIDIKIQISIVETTNLNQENSLD
jgi:hypothetical protein